MIKLPAKTMASGNMATVNRIMATTCEPSVYNAIVEDNDFVAADAD